MAKYVVDLGSLKLSRDLTTRLDKEIRRTVLAQLADVDLKGDIRVGPLRDPGTMGIWVEVINEVAPKKA